MVAAAVAASTAVVAAADTDNPHSTASASIKRLSGFPWQPFLLRSHPSFRRQLIPSQVFLHSADERFD
jgi:hypothetical protein